MTDKQRPEISASTLKGDVRDFLLTWIQNQSTPYHKMTERSQKDVIWAAEMHAHNLISAITMAIAGRGFEKAFVRISDFAIKDGVVSKVTADSTQSTVLNFLAYKGKAAVLVFADPAVYAAERRPAKYFPDEPNLPGVDDEPTDPPEDSGGPGAAEKPPKADTSRPGGKAPAVSTRIPQAFTGHDEPQDPWDGDIWRDSSGTIWGRKDGRWVDPKGNERPADPPASQAAEGAEGSQKSAETSAQPAPAGRQRMRFEGHITRPPIDGDVWVPAGQTTAFTYDAAKQDWVDPTTGEIRLVKPDDLALGEAGEQKASPQDPPAPKTKKVDNPAPPGEYFDKTTGKIVKDPGEPAEVTEDDSGQRIITKSTGEPNATDEEGNVE